LGSASSCTGSSAFPVRNQVHETAKLSLRLSFAAVASCRSTFKTSSQAPRIRFPLLACGLIEVGHFDDKST
jgi:hypothetical protein